MGLNSTSAKALSGAKAHGADFTKVAMLGRQDLVADERTLSRIYSFHRAPPPSLSRYAEPFFEALGAQIVHSFDASDFEGATDIHDMNLPIPDQYKGAYSLLFDGGTTEHIFNIPQALTNAMQMLRVGGYFVQMVPANNWMGHGFWQFSPEYAYRCFAPENGFEPIAVLVQEEGRACYLARDPDKLGWRVGIRNRLPTSLIVIARKVAERPLFAQAPQQSDYSAAWLGKEQGVTATGKYPLVNLIRKILPPQLERSLRPTFLNQAHARVSDADVMRGNFPGVTPPASN